MSTDEFARKEAAPIPQDTQGASATCSCIDHLNAKLAEFGGELLGDMLHEPARAFVATYRRRGRKKLPLVQAAFCPFCGAMYPPQASIFKAGA